MKKFSVQMIFLFLMTACYAVEPLDIFVWDDFKDDFSHGIQGELIAKKTIPISRGISLAAVIEVTARGNGFLKIASGQYRVVDCCGNTETYLNGGLLHIKALDINRDGYNDLLLFGVKKVMDDDDDNKVIAYRPEFSIYIYRKHLKVFENTAGSVDPYSLVRSYDDISPKNRIMLPRKYLYNKDATSDTVMRDVDGDGKPERLEYGLKKGGDELFCYLKIYFDEEPGKTRILEIH